MPETIQGLGRILGEWRLDDRDAAGESASIDEWAARLVFTGCMASRIAIAHLLHQAEDFDSWTLTFSCDCFDEFLASIKRNIYRGQRDDQRWTALNTVFRSPKRRCLGIRNL